MFFSPGKTLFLLSLTSTVAAFIVTPQVSVSSAGRSRFPPLGPTAANGLSYEDIQVGNGQAVKKGDQVSIHYTGYFKNKLGVKVQFENSRTTKVNKGVIGATEGMPIIFPIGKGKVIEGWEQGIMGDNSIPAMKIGGKRNLKIPADLAYGQQGRGKIPGNQDLLFDVELIDINIETENFLNKFFLIGTPGIFAFLILNSIYLTILGNS